MTKNKRTSDRLRDHNAERVVRDFVRRINRRDVERLIQLMANRHVLIDSLGHRLEGGRQTMREAWAGYFQMVPEYRIRAKATFVRSNTVIVVGIASGGYVSSKSTASVGTWSTPAAWRAVVRRGRVAEWQVYADNEPIREMMRQRINNGGLTAAAPVGGHAATS